MTFTVMVVDEETPVRSLAKAGLEPLGCEVVEQSDGRAAATVAQTRKLHLVLLGPSMQHFDGIELAHAIRRSRSNSSIPIAMVTAGDDARTVRRSIDAGIHFFLAEPVSQERLAHFFRTMRRARWEDRRRSSRVPLRAAAPCRSSAGTLEFETRNISMGGMLLEPCDRLTRCQEIELKFPLPGYDRPIRVIATVRHQAPEVGVGVKFQDISPANQRAIDSYISGALEKQG